MTARDNGEVSRRFSEEVCTTGNLDAINDLVTHDAVHRDVGGRFKIGGDATDHRFVAAPLHRHHNEDEYTYLVKGTLGAMVEDEVLTAEPGTWLVKPRGQWHTFWNAGYEPCHMIEIVAPAGFENYVNEVAGSGSDMERLAQINEKYSIDMNLESIPELCQRFELTYPEMGG